MIMKREIVRVAPCPRTWSGGKHLRRLPRGTAIGLPLGVSALRPATSEVANAPIERQTGLVLEEMKLCLETARASLDNCAQVQCLLHVDRGVCCCERALHPLRPATCAGADLRECSGLARPGHFDIEIDCIAAVK